MADYIPTPNELYLERVDTTPLRRALRQYRGQDRVVFIRVPDEFHDMLQDSPHYAHILGYVFDNHTLQKAQHIDHTSFTVFVDGDPAHEITFTPPVYKPKAEAPKIVDVPEHVRVIYSDKALEVCSMDRPGPGGACHQYEVFSNDDTDHGRSLMSIHFQEGPVKHNGVNGLQHEPLIAIIIDRMQAFQAGKYACKENEQAIMRLEEALMWMNKRTSDREKRGVEGRLRP